MPIEVFESTFYGLLLAIGLISVQNFRNFLARRAFLKDVKPTYKKAGAIKVGDKIVWHNEVSKVIAVGQNPYYKKGCYLRLDVLRDGGPVDKLVAMPKKMKVELL